jgi:hypothetical protein
MLVLFFIITIIMTTTTTIIIIIIIIIVLLRGALRLAWECKREILCHHHVMAIEISLSGRILLFPALSLSPSLWKGREKLSLEKDRELSPKGMHETCGNRVTDKRDPDKRLACQAGLSLFLLLPFSDSALWAAATAPAEELRVETILSGIWFLFIYGFPLWIYFTPR